MPLKQSLCPKCGKRPRRKPGNLCNPCSAEQNKRLRAIRKSGAPKATRVTVDEDVQTRFTRPLNATRYLITSAQNATPIHEAFFKTLKLAAEYLGAELVVIPLRYKNPTSVWTRNQESQDWWVEEVKPYLHNTRKKLNPNLVLAADVKIQPTAASPLTGFEALTGGESCIIGHPKMQFRSVAAPSGRFPKILSTTGACTRRNYTDTKAGKLGAFHHFLGALDVEVEGKTFHLRQINADRIDGSFTNLDLHFTAEGVKKAPRAAGLVMGDTHARFIDPKVEAATFGPGGIVDTLKPGELVWEDVFDGYSVNHHHAGNPFISAAKAKAQFTNVRDEVEHAVKFVADRTPSGCRSVIVASNHDDFLSRWVINSDWKHAGANAEFYLETALMMRRSAKMTANGAEFADPFRYWVDRLKGGANIKCLDERSHKIVDVEVSMHGHAGPNGAPSTMKNMARLGAKIVDGHGHTPGIEEGHYRVGTSTPLKLEYTHGPSSWLNTHCVIYANGKRALITIIDGAWRAARLPRKQV